ncbi:MAG TPA: serine/threonine-protein kinase [Xanthobacteraceae bacterium]
MDETLEREVAIKVLNPDLGDPEILKRFRAEAITLARLNHPNIATLYEFAQHEHDLLMVMEFVQGETFDRLSDRFGPLPFDRAASLCSQVLDALSHAHRATIVHRDLKPANLMVTGSGLVKVMDFGIARVAGTEHLTTDGYMMGTPAYMAPEQVMGNEVDGRADIYSMGVVLYRLLTANLPFKADTAIAMAQKQIKDPPTPLRQFRAELPSWCQDILDKALAKAPADRFQTADEFRAALSLAPAHVAAAAASPALTTVGGQAMSGMDVTVPPNVMMTPVAGVRTERVAQDLPADAAPRVPPPAAAHPAPPVSALPRRAITRTTKRLVMAALVVASIAGAAVAVRMRRVPVVVTSALNPGSTSAAPPAAPAPSTTAPPAPTSSTTATPAPAAAAPVVPAPAATSPGSRAGRAASNPKPVPGPKPESTVASPATETPAPEVVRPASPPLPPLVFKSVDLLTLDGGKTRDRDAALKLADGAVQVVDGETRLKSAPYDAILAIYYSHSRDPQWLTPAGTAMPVVKVDGGKFRLFKGDRDWLTVRTKSEFILLKPESSSIGRIVAALESRTGLKVIRVGERD